MYSVFKFILYFGVVLGLAGFFWERLAELGPLASAPPETRNILSFGGLGLVILGYIGRLATKPESI